MTQCLDFIDDNFGIDPGMVELAKALVQEHVQLEALKHFQRIESCHCSSVKYVSSGERRPTPIDHPILQLHAHPRSLPE